MNIQELCCISRDNCNLKSTIIQQSNEIGKLLEEKRVIQDQYEKLLQLIDSIDINKQQETETSAI